MRLESTECVLIDIEEREEKRKEKSALSFVCFIHIRSGVPPSRPFVLTPPHVVVLQHQRPFSFSLLVRYFMI